MNECVFSPRSRQDLMEIYYYIALDDLDAVEAALKSFPVAVPKRKTFYETTEIGIREPGGNIVLFSVR